MTTHVNAPKQMLFVAVLAGSLLSGCQSTPSNDLTSGTVYQTSTGTSGDRNSDRQEAARVRTSLA
ncbi:hypothetical protein R0J93_23960, partial [Pseudoalteromonas sp. SIMBA_148]